MSESETLPAAARERPAKSQRKNRRCLMCRETFASEWAGERVCPQCKSKRAWRDGVPPHRAA